MGHFIFSSKILRREFSGHLHNPDLKSDGSSDRFISGQFTESFLSPIIELVITCDRIYQGFPVRLFFDWARSSSRVEVARLRSSDGFVNSWSNPDYKIRKWLYPWSCVMWSDPNLFFSADCKIYCPWHLTNWLPRNIIIITIYRKYYRSKHINSN